MISRERLRFAITVIGVGFTAVLMLLLFGVYEGVQQEANGYVSSRPVDIWMSQGNGKNLIRSSSFVSESLLVSLKETEEISRVAPLLRIIDTVNVRGKEATLFILGLDPESSLTSPDVIEGVSQFTSGEIIVDKAFARKYELQPGDTIQIRGDDYRIVGLSVGTNAVITQFSFVSLNAAQKLINFPGLISFALIEARKGINTDHLVDMLKDEYPEMSVYTQEQFEQNNLDELRTGLLPILWTIAIVGAVVGVAILSLLMYGAVIERKEDYALLKALGGSQSYLVWLLLRQSLVVILFGYVFGIVTFYTLKPIIINLVPEIAISVSATTMVLVGLAVMGISTIAAVLPIHRLGRVYPAEVFRA